MAIRPSRLLRSLLLAGAGALLAACGGGEPAADAPSVGVLTDSRVQGVEYLTSSGLGGVTSANGSFNYKPGDIIVFKLGGVLLGLVHGTGSSMTVTPIQLVQGATAIDTATKRQNAVTNLLVLLQSLDSDGNPGNGISIGADARLAMQDVSLSDILNAGLVLDPNTFSTNMQFNNLLTSLGLTATTPAAALAHFKTEFLESLAGQYYGISNNMLFAFRFRADGSYLMTQVLASDGSSDPGLERGAVTWDPATGRIAASTDLDTNGSLGFSYLASSSNSMELALDNGDLVITERDGSDAVLGTYRLGRVSNSSSGLGGAWIKGSQYSLNALHLFFLPGGYYLALDPTAGDTSLLGTDAGCASSGMEMGDYGLQSGLIVFANAYYDSTGCAGTHNSGQYWTPAYSLSGGTLQVSTASGFATFYRPENINLP